MDRYGRPLSPGGRRVSQPTRSSTGTLVYPSSFDPYYAPTRSSREFSTTAGPRTSADRVAQPRTIPRYRPESPPPRQSRDDYVVRPRRPTLDPEPAEIRRPLSVMGPGEPNRSSRPVITTSDRPSSPLSKPGRSRPEEPYLLQPASSTRREHRRNYTVGSTDASRSVTGERGGYRSSGIGGGRNGYNLNQPLVRQPAERDRGGYEYTDRREQMYRDTEPRPRPRRDSYSGGGRERPLSMTGLEDYLPRLERPNRDAGPPVSTRGFGAIGRAGSLRQGPGSRDYDLASDFSRDDYERRKAHIPRVALHQNAGDGYVPSISSRDDESAYEDARDRRPRQTAFEDEVIDKKPRDAYDDQYDRIRRPKGPIDDGKTDLRPRDRYPEDYDRAGDDRSRRHHDKGPYKDERDDDRERRRRDEAPRDLRAEPPRERRNEAPRERRDDGYRDNREDIPKEKRYHGDHGVDDGLILGGAAAATGLAAGAARSHHRHKDSRDDRDIRHDTVREPDRDRLAVREPTESNSASTVSREESDEERRARHQRRRERRERKDREAREFDERERRRVADESGIPREPAARVATTREPEPRSLKPQDRPQLQTIPSGYEFAPPTTNVPPQDPRGAIPREPERRRDHEELAPPQPLYERHSHEDRLDTM
ncbi:MAG: hypothetical protein Q9222_000063, partial [Ikaeria aurantiellina]